MSNQIDITLPTPHTGGQKEVFLAPHRFKVVACGRRWGKTEYGKTEIILTALKAGKVVWWVSPTYRMSSRIWRDLLRTLHPLITRKDSTERVIELINGSIIQLWTATNADTMRGDAPDLVVIDEAAMIHDADMWSAVIRPALSDKQGRALFLSTPRGRNWFWHVYQQGLDPLQTDYYSWSFPSTSNPTIKHINEEVEDARRSLPDRIFRQEYLAEFMDDAGGVFRGVLDVATAEPVKRPYEGNFIFGVDWGRHNDYTVISVFDKDTKTQVALDRLNSTAWEVQYAAIRRLNTMWKPSVIYMEDNGIGDAPTEKLVNEGLPIHRHRTTGQNKNPMIEAYAAAIEWGDVTLLNDRLQIAEHQAYEIERTPSGNFRYNAPDGAHDDTVMAAALAWQALSGADLSKIEFFY